jgi:hypothetical protein
MRVAGNELIRDGIPVIPAGGGRFAATSRKRMMNSSYA